MVVVFPARILSFRCCSFKDQTAISRSILRACCPQATRRRRGFRDKESGAWRDHLRGTLSKTYISHINSIKLVYLPIHEWHTIYGKLVSKRWYLFHTWARMGIII